MENDNDNNNNPTNDNEYDEEMFTTILEFLHTFQTISSEHYLENITDLTDGVVLFEALSEIAPDYFDPTTIARHLGDNWALKQSNLRKLIRNLQDYYHTILHRDYNHINWNTIDLQSIARYNHISNIILLCQLVIAAAVTCPEKHLYIQRIMSMSSTSQIIMKNIIQQSMQQLVEYEPETDDIDNDNDHENHHDDSANQYDDENELVFDETTMMKSAIDDDDHNNTNNNISTKLFHSTTKKNSINNNNNQNMNTGENVQYDELVREIASLKLQATITTEEYQKSESKLSLIIEDLQDRLMKRQDELIQVEEDLQRTVSELEETKSKLNDIIEQKLILEDDLDIMKVKAQQLYKAEATVVAYKKKLDSIGTKHQQMEDLEGQAEKYLRQIMTLESEVKKSSMLQKTVTIQEDTIRKLEKSISEYTTTSKNAVIEITELKNRLLQVESTKKMYEDELNELKMKFEQQQQQQEDDNTAKQQQQQKNNTENGMTSDQREKMMRLEIENQQLRERLGQLETGSANNSSSNNKSDIMSSNNNTNTNDETTPFAIAIPTAISSDVIDGYKNEIQRLQDTLKQKEQENLKIASDKDKLEAYTKRTLAKFQDKYLVALQECKAKLKEKQDKIELLEKRSLTERNIQKREERLLSSTIYELGLGIMQNKLKNTSGSLISSSSSTTTATATPSSTQKMTSSST